MPFDLAGNETDKREDFQARVGIKGSGGGKKETHKAAPNDILVQRMSSTASGRLKKFEPLNTRDFVPFGEYDDLTIENIKEACKKYYQAPGGSCDILASDRGPSCTKLEQVKGKKVSFNQNLVLSQKQVSHCLRTVLHHPSRLGPHEVQ